MGKTKKIVHDVTAAVEGFIAKNLLFTLDEISKGLNIPESKLRAVLARMEAEKKIEQSAPDTWRH